MITSRLAAGSRIVLSACLLLLPQACGSGGGAPTATPQMGPPAPPAPPPPEGHRPATAAGLENLAAFAKLMGYVRHFHPADEAVRTDWTFATIAGMRLAEAQNTPEDLARFLQGYFQPLAPTVQVYLAGQAPPLPGELQPAAAATRLLWWDNQGWGQESPATWNTPYHNRQVAASLAAGPEWLGPPSQTFRADLPRGLACSVPLSLYGDATHTLPRATASLPYTVYSGTDNADRATRLAGVALAWNVIEHFFCYGEVVAPGWDPALREALAGAATAPDLGAFGDTLGRMWSRLQDGHGYLTLPGADPTVLPPFYLDWVENRWTVAVARPGLPAGILPGDALVAVDGVPVDAVWQAFAATHSGSEQWNRAQARQFLLARAQPAVAQVSFQRLDGSTYAAAVPIQSNPEVNTAVLVVEPRPAPIADLPGGVLYVDPFRATSNQINAQRAHLLQAPGLVVDLRGYAQSDFLAAYNLLALLQSTDNVGSYVAIPQVFLPGQPTALMRESVLTTSAGTGAYSGKVAVLMDGRVISAGESALSAWVAAGYPRVGSSSAGANGFESMIRLPGGATLTYTGERVTKGDHGVLFVRGFQPTVAVGRTRAGVAAGLDELLEAARRLVAP